MDKRIFAVAALIGLAACGGGESESGAAADSASMAAPATDTMMTAPATTPAPMPGDTMGAMTAPMGTDSAAMGAGATTTPMTGTDSAAAGAAGATTTTPTP